MKICGLSFSRFFLSGKVVTKTTTHMKNDHSYEYPFEHATCQATAVCLFPSHAQNYTDE